LARVVDQEGKGVAGATVTFTKNLARDCKGNPTQPPPAWHGISVQTNEKGEFNYPSEIWQVEDETQKHRIEAKIEAEGFLPRGNVEVGINYGDDKGLIDIFRIGRIEGAVIDPNGQPIAKVPVWLNPFTRYKTPGSSCSGCFSANVLTDDNGGFVFDKVPPGMHIIKFPGQTGNCDPNKKAADVPFEDYATFVMMTMTDGEVKPDVFVDLRQKRGVVTGKVVDGNNRAMAGVNAVLIRVVKHYHEHGWSSQSSSLKTVTTDQNGVYVMKHIPGGDYQLQAQYPYQEGKNYTSGKPLSIYLASGQEAHFNLVLERQDGSAGKSDARKESLFEVELPKGLGAREMMIVDPRGNGVAGASVVFDTTLTTEDQQSGKNTTAGWKGASLTTDAKGVFVLPEAIVEIEGTRFSCPVIIKAEGFEVRDATVRSDSLSKEDRRIDLLPLSRVRGRVIGLEGQPIPNAGVYLLDRMTAYHNPGSAESGGSYGSMITNQNGEFSFDGIPEGICVLEYRFWIPDKKKEHKGSFVVYTQGGKDVDDLVIDLRQATCGVRGSVTDWDGKPIRKASVRLSKGLQWGYSASCSFSREFYRSGLTGRKGDYIIENIQPGVYEIEAVVEGNPRRASEKMMIAVSDGQAIELEIRLTP
jgi:protocatechuate 3,4-dioxygenase beta subunit